MAKAEHDDTRNTRTTKSQSAEPATEAVDLERMIAEAAYYKAQQRQFAPGGEMQDWLDAEREVNERRQDV